MVPESASRVGDDGACPHVQVRSYVWYLCYLFYLFGNRLFDLRGVYMLSFLSCRYEFKEEGGTLSFVCCRA